MYTRNRPNPGYANARNQNNSNVGYQGQSTYNQQGGFQGVQAPPNQQVNFKPGNVPNQMGYKAPPHPQQTPMQTPIQPPMQPPMQPPLQPVMPPQMQQDQPGRNAQQLKPLMGAQKQQRTPTNAPSPQRLKPILKQSTAPPQQPPPVAQNPSSAPHIPCLVAPSAPKTATPPVTQPTTSTPTSTSVSTTQSGSNHSIEIKVESLQSKNTDVEMKEQPRWRRKVPGFKVNKKLKRLRLNQRLRKTLQPKNAIMVLNEMKAGVQFTFPETQGPMPNLPYLVHAELDGKTYVGQGLSKPLARQDAAENALKALLLEKMTAASMKARIFETEADGQLNQSADSLTTLTTTTTTTTTKDGSNEDGTTPMDTTVDENNEIPWSSLASFALYKLFLEWHNQGTSVPVPRPGLPQPNKGSKKETSNTPKVPVQKELPPNATTIHPVMLLNQMRPGLIYVELCREGNPPHTMFTLAVDVDSVQYTGTAKNKKDAKKIAAKAALLALYDLTYPDDTSGNKSTPEQSEVVQIA